MCKGRNRFFPAFPLLLLVPGFCGAAETKINGVVYTAPDHAGQQITGPLPPEQALRLKKLFLFPSLDDVNGAMAPKLDERLFELFSKNSRFEVVRDPQVVRALSPDDSAYAKASQSSLVHKEAAKVTGADTTVLLRSRNVGQTTQMRVELRDAGGQLLFLEEGSVPGTASLEARSNLIAQLYGSLVSRLPFEGTITGRTSGTITVDLGLGTLRQGEEVELARIVSLQRHPLLGTIVGTDYVRTGRARITSVDRVLSFAEIIEEMPGEKVGPGQKILHAGPAKFHRPEAPAPDEAAAPERKPLRGKKQAQEAEDPFEERLKGEFDEPKARYGQLAAGIQYGVLSYTQSAGGTPAAYSGSGIGGEVSGELWVTRNWIISGSYGIQSATLNVSGATGAGSSSLSELGLFGGFRLLPGGLGDGLVLTGSVGYQSLSFDIPSNTALTLSSKHYSGLGVRAEGDIRFMEKHRVSVGLGIMPFSSFTEGVPALGRPSSATVVSLNLAWGRQLMELLWFRLGGRYLIANGSYEGSSDSVSNKQFSIGPALVYAF